VGERTLEWENDIPDVECIINEVCLSQGVA